MKLIAYSISTPKINLNYNYDVSYFNGSEHWITWSSDKDRCTSNVNRFNYILIMNTFKTYDWYKKYAYELI
jgi:hypothetical protein